jgi:methyl-accepting chemotaxis protein
VNGVLALNTVILVEQSSKMGLDLGVESLSNLAGWRAEYWKGREDGYLRALDTLADVMESYPMVPVLERRDFIDNMMAGMLAAEENIVVLYSIWKPNAIDGRDAENIGRPGSTPTGQYAVAFSRETGTIEKRTSIDIEASMAHINGPNAARHRIDQPSIRKVNGKDVNTVVMMVPIHNPFTKEVVGGLAMLINTALLQPIMVRMLESDTSVAAAAIYASNGLIMASYIPERVGRFLTDDDSIFGGYTQEASRSIRAGEDRHFQSFDANLGMDLEIVIKSFEIGDSGVTWSVMVAKAKDVVLEPVSFMKKFSITLAMIMVAISIVIIYFTLQYVLKPIVSVADTLKDIAQGEGDLTRTIHVKSKDEIGRMARYFNMTMEKIRNLIVQIKGEAATLSDIGNDLASNMNETAAAVNQINANIQSIKDRIMRQGVSVSETHTTMGNLVTSINKLDGHIEKQSSNISQASTAIEEMVANIRSVTDTLMRNADNVETLTDASEVGRTGLQGVSADIQEIARESEGLLEINSVMQNIASQTNLLSMNAAIEAAHAGEAGKGFAVVADEIRKLAESSGQQSKTIGVVLKKIKESIDKITKSTENVLSKFGAIDTSVRTVSDQEENIRNSMEEQGTGSKQILEGVGNINEITRQVKADSREMLEEAKEVIKESQSLERATQEITSGMNEMSNGAEHINIAVNQVNEISIKNREAINTLLHEVARFKVD